MSYTLEKFIADCRSTLSDHSSRKNREIVRASLCQLLLEDDFVNNNCGPKLEAGTSLLYHDKDLGFQIIAYIMGDAYEGGPHDHGSSWAIYGQAVRYTDMTEWTRIDDSSKDGFAKIKKAKEYRLERGDAGIFNDHQIHSISYPAGARFIRVTGTDLSTIKRGHFNPKKNTVSLTKRENFSGSA